MRNNKIHKTQQPLDIKSGAVLNNQKGHGSPRVTFPWCVVLYCGFTGPFIHTAASKMGGWFDPEAHIWGTPMNIVQHFSIDNTAPNSFRHAVHLSNTWWIQRSRKTRHPTAQLTVCQCDVILEFLVPFLEDDFAWFCTNLRCNQLFKVPHKIVGCTFNSNFLTQSIIYF